MPNKDKIFQSAYINFSESTGEFEKRFLDCLIQRKIDVDFTFWGRDTTQAWISILQSNDYNFNISENNLLNKNLDEINNIIDRNKEGMNLISLSCGLLDREKSLLSKLTETKEITYVPIDPSIDIINASLKNVGQINNLEILPFISTTKYLDKITKLVRNNYYEASIFTLFSNLIGNHKQTPLLSKINQSMTNRDYLLLGVELLSDNFENKDFKQQNTEIKNIIGSYNNESYLNFLYIFIYRAGFNKEDGFFEIEFTKDKLYPSLYTIEIYFYLKQDKEIQYLGESIIYRKGERIQIRFSYLYSSEGIKEILEENKFKIEKNFISENKDFTLLLCKKNIN
jgi:uncharacterized SAM-dependent methyltransferase